MVGQSRSSTAPRHHLLSEVKDVRLIAERRRLFIDVALALFRAKGYRGTTVREIARAAGVSVGLLYLYFRSKEDILAVACQEFVERFIAAATAVTDTSTDPCERLRRDFALLVDVVDMASDLHILVYREMPNLPRETRRFITQQELTLVSRFQAVLDEGVAHGCFRPHNTRLRAHSLVMLGHMWALKRWALRSVMTAQQYAAEQIDICLRGIAAGDFRHSTERV